jgi:HlyD family secretion protein
VTWVLSFCKDITLTTCLIYGVQSNSREANREEMDIPRAKSVGRNKKLRNILLGVAVILAVSLITFGISYLKPAAPSIERSAMLIDTVKRGPMLRQVRGVGTLVPEEVRVIAASTEGRIERILVQPGTEVSAGTLLLELSNPELQQSVVDSEYQLRAAEADYNNLKVRLESDRMTQQAAAASVRSEYQQAKIQMDTDEALAKDGLIPALSLKLSRVKTEELANRYQIEQNRVQSSVKGTQAQLASQQARIEQIKALLELKRVQFGSLRVLAGTNGVLQQMQVEVGQQVTPGTNLAKVVEPQHLKAELKVAETLAKDVHLNQPAMIDTRNGVIPGHVVRVDPAASQGTVTLDVALDGQLPQGARPDLTIDGTIELEHLQDVVYINRPAFGQPQSTVNMFKLEGDGRTAVRVSVKLGRSSVNTIEILEGLQPGDRVILSDTSAWDNSTTVRLN